MTDTDDLIRANEQFARSFGLAGLSAPPARRLAVITCMDARLDPGEFLGLVPGDAHVIRNAGGRVSDDVLRSLIISSHLLGTEEYVVIHHTNCGLSGMKNDDVRRTLTQETGVDASHLDFLPFDDLEESVREDMARIRENPFIPSVVSVRGFVYDVCSGRLTEVSGESARSEAAAEHDPAS